METNLTPALVSDNTQLDLWRDTIADFEKQIQNLPAGTDSETRHEILKQANKALTDFDEIRKAVGEPYRKQVEHINRVAKNMTLVLSGLIDDERKVLARQFEALEAARRQRERENEAALKAAQSWSQLPLVHAIPPKPAGSVVVWDYEVSNFALLPDEYKVASPVAIKQAMKMLDKDGLPVAVPGVRFFKKMQTRL